MRMLYNRQECLPAPPAVSAAWPASGQQTRKHQTNTARRAKNRAGNPAAHSLFSVA
jgi:hypothetical protein